MALKDQGDYAGAEDALKKCGQKAAGLDLCGATNSVPSIGDRTGIRNAAEQFRKAVDSDDKYAVVVFNLGEAEYLNNNLGEAKKAYSRLKKLGRNDLATRLEVVTGGKVKG